MNVWSPSSTCGSSTPCAEIGHVALIASGPKAGWVVFWRADAARPQPTYIWNVLPVGSSVVYEIALPSNVTGLPCNAGNVFCSGHSFLPDGTLVTAGADVACNSWDPAFCPYPWPMGTGGIRGSHESWRFDPSVLTDPQPPTGWAAWSFLGFMTFRRWYASALTLADGDVLVAGGLEDGCTSPPPLPNHGYSNNVEYLDFQNLGAGWISPTPPIGLPSPSHFVLYPHVRLLSGADPSHPTADMIVIGHEGAAGWNANNAWLLSRSNQADVAVIANSPFTREEGNTIPVPGYTDRFAQIGGAPTGAALGLGQVDDIQSPQNPGVTWVQTWGNLNAWRAFCNTVLLPDETILNLGGATGDYYADPLLACPVAVLTTELLDPSAPNPWQVLAPARHRRLYHSVALLLPDARVLTMGGEWAPLYDPFDPGDCSNVTFESDVEIFNPPYLFRGPRPIIRQAQTPILYNGSANLVVCMPPGTSLDKVVLVRPGSVTHAVDFEQRVERLQIQAQTNLGPCQPGGWTRFSVTVGTPLNGNDAPPGYYMMFALTDGGVPSVAAFVKLQH